MFIFSRNWLWTPLGVELGYVNWWVHNCGLKPGSDYQSSLKRHPCPKKMVWWCKWVHVLAVYRLDTVNNSSSIVLLGKEEPPLSPHLMNNKDQVQQLGTSIDQLQMSWIGTMFFILWIRMRMGPLYLIIQKPRNHVRQSWVSPGHGPLTSPDGNGPLFNWLTRRI